MFLTLDKASSQNPLSWAPSFCERDGWPCVFFTRAPTKNAVYNMKHVSVGVCWRAPPHALPCAAGSPFCRGPVGAWSHTHLESLPPPKLPPPAGRAQPQARSALWSHFPIGILAPLCFSLAERGEAGTQTQMSSAENIHSTHSVISSG